jgi:CheY-like chemotaxis protein
LGLPGTADSAITADADTVLIDAGTQSVVDLPAWPYPNIRSVVLLTPGARGKLAQFRTMGFAAYLVKPVRQSSLADRIRAKGESSGSEPADSDWVQPSFAVRPSVRVPSESAPVKILLAEDNPVNALVIRELLLRRGHQVFEVASGEAAIAALSEGTFDLMLTDIHMPGLDGIEATRRIRALEAASGRPRTPIIALTADALETGKQACQDAGMDGFLTKPIDPAELDAMIAKMFPNETKPREAAA